MNDGALGLMVFVGVMSLIPMFAIADIKYKGNPPRVFILAFIAWEIMWVVPPLAKLWITGVLG